MRSVLVILLALGFLLPIAAQERIYFPLWFRPKADLAWLPGYDGKKHPFAAVMFNLQFRARYRDWWTALLTTPGARSGKKLIDEPALMGAELQNEDSFFFWTFNEQNIPEPQLEILESLFTDWAKRKYGSIEKALAAWNNLPRHNQKLSLDASPTPHRP